jgi:hypothetical protein
LELDIDVELGVRAVTVTEVEVEKDAEDTDAGTECRLVERETREDVTEDGGRLAMGIARC